MKKEEAIHKRQHFQLIILQSAGWRNRWRNDPSWFHPSVLAWAPHNLKESSPNFPFESFGIMRSERASQCRVILLFIIKTGPPWSWEGTINNHIGTTSIKKHCPRQIKLYGHPTFACFIRRVIRYSFGDYVLQVDLLGLNSNLVTYNLCDLCDLWFFYLILLCLSYLINKMVASLDGRGVLGGMYMYSWVTSHATKLLQHC